MLQAEIIKHWHRGAHDALDAARLLAKNGKYALALFHCHLAVEKALKAVFILEKDKNPPPTHDLSALAEQLSSHWSEQEEDLLDDLSGYSTAARYEDQRWHEEKATKENVAAWLKNTDLLFKKLDQALHL